MTLMTLGQVHALLAPQIAARLVGDPATAFDRVHTDTRSLQPGDLFVALRGERFDGHDHLPQAHAAGAAAVLVERGLDQGAALPGLVVPDTLEALQALAKGWRKQMRLPLVAVTGSNGKTTVTQMIASIFRAWYPQRTLATAGNLNNHIGVPLTLLRLRQDDALWHCAAVLELGMNHPGEIALLAQLAAPTVALVNNAQREHLEFMHSVEAVARENGSVISALPANGTAVLPADDAHAPLWRRLAAGREVISFALEGPADVSLEAANAAVWNDAAGRWSLELRTPSGPVTTTLRVPGRHNLHNAVAACAAAMAAGAPLAAIASGLAAFEPVAGRSQASVVQLHGHAATLIDDSYNANPDSVLAAIAVLSSMPGPRWLLLGDMGEVGSEGPRFHAEAGAAARKAGIDHFWAVGALAAHAAADRHFGSMAELLSALRAEAPDSLSVLVKGSRFMQMERVVQTLRASAHNGATHAA
ncbi:MAG: UDP-N-acetylmuramoyl-tripeptide--D-alanyl-D-alanine ligase [Pseudomonadota bacterium]|nr:UDP-N-acetylmuramoyl-tripeptide--D-alanyl-D-alanine ligase [Pseudomonadota bacterium]